MKRGTMRAWFPLFVAGAVISGCAQKPPTNTAATVVFATRTGKKYHLDGCTFLNKSKIPMTLQEAVDKGLTPCTKCNPPTLRAANE